MSRFNVPIWVTNWVVEYRPLRGKPTRFDVSQVIAKGIDSDAVLNNPHAFKRSLRTLFGKKKELTQELIAKYHPISVELVKQVGLGINED